MTCLIVFILANLFVLAVIIFEEDYFYSVDSRYSETRLIKEPAKCHNIRVVGCLSVIFVDFGKNGGSASRLIRHFRIYCVMKEIP